MMQIIVAYFALLLAASYQLNGADARKVTDKNAVVTLVTGASSGYVSGALALGQSLIDKILGEFNNLRATRGRHTST